MQISKKNTPSHHYSNAIIKVFQVQIKWCTRPTRIQNIISMTVHIPLASSAFFPYNLSHEIKMLTLVMCIIHWSNCFNNPPLSPPPLSLDNPRAFDGRLWLGKGGGEFNPYLARVRKLSWKCQVFPTENTCFIFSYWGVYKVMGSLFQGNGSEKNVKEVKVFMLGQWVNLWCFFLPSNPALEEGIWTQFWPQGMGQSILQKFKCSEGSPGGEMLKLWINWLTTHSISSYSFKC